MYDHPKNENHLFTPQLALYIVITVITTLMMLSIAHEMHSWITHITSVISSAQTHAQV